MKRRDLILLENRKPRIVAYIYLEMTTQDLGYNSDLSFTV